MIHVISGWLNNEHQEISNIRWFLDKVLLQTLTRYAVPGFIMISGCLLLNPKREVGIKKIKKYILKMLCILGIFGFGYCLLEYITILGFSNGFKLIYKSISDLLQEDVWVHLWYIYMLIGLYIITPILRNFIEFADTSTTKFMLGTLFFISMVIPTLNEIFNIQITQFYLESFKYIFIYLMGYYVVNTDIIKEKNIYIGGIFGIVSYALLGYFKQTGSQTNLFIILETMLIVKLFSSGKIKIKNNKWIDCISKYSLGIYLIHQFWLNLLYKIVGVFPDRFPILIGELIVFLYALILSIISSIILYKLPIIKKIW